jgi:hypothetical protein
MSKSHKFENNFTFKNIILDTQHVQCSILIKLKTNKFYTFLKTLTS